MGRQEKGRKKLDFLKLFLYCTIFVCECLLWAINFNGRRLLEFVSSPMSHFLFHLHVFALGVFQFVSTLLSLASCFH